jgi:hypothetical protein
MSVSETTSVDLDVPDRGEGGAATAPSVEPLLALDEVLGEEDRLEYRPAGAGAELTTASQDLEPVVDYQVPRDRTALLETVAAEVDGSGSVVLSVAGTTFGPFSGSVSVSLPFDGAKLPGGHSVRVFASSAEGIETTAVATIVVREV